MPRKSLLVLGAAAALAGCATKPVVKDTTPLRPTAVIEKHVTSNGIRGFVPFETNETDYVRANMLRDDSTFKGTGTFTRFLLGSHNGTKIYRLDRRLLWTLNTDKQEYTECPLRGCPRPEAPAGKPQPAPRQQPQAAHERGCTMRVAHSSVSVAPTGKTQNINGFNTEEYKVAWVIALRDNKRRTSTSRLDVDIWTTPLTRDMRDAMDMDAEYRRAFAADTREPGAQHPELLPKQAAQLIMSYLGASLHARDYRKFFNTNGKLHRIKGHPIRTTLTWDISGNACEPEERPQRAEARTSRTPTSVSGLVDMFTERETRKAAEQSGKEPLLSFTVEVRQMKVAPLHDSVFAVPADYKRVQPE